MSSPGDLKYTQEHEWIRVEGNTATVGITDFAQSELGDLVYIEVDTLDEELDKDDVFGTVEAVKTTSELFMPVSGKVIAFNSELDEDEGDNPAIINEDPYGEGWIVRIEMSDTAELENLLSAEAYEEIIS
ncbi:MAG: glycine cleavage system protein GcvH [Bacteroidetes bacterium]|jgi:glycine cleavage system H protein|nr:glycine cleavage system protein GcvH [Bacteroidota bacterium]